jgi:hypothetical protein
MYIGTMVYLEVYIFGEAYLPTSANSTSDNVPLSLPTYLAIHKHAEGLTEQISKSDVTVPSGQHTRWEYIRLARAALVEDVARSSLLYLLDLHTPHHPA